MTGTFCTGWDRRDTDEWARLPSWWQRMRMIWQLRKEMRSL
ncbi:hypothetical protein [Curtobacterium sp. Csp2]|nr:hypothetical protein [Curtobacterium sp. Csp2]